MLKAGIVGLPNVGKSTLFNAITKKNILAANYPFATIDPNVGIVTVPDYRLEELEKIYIPEKVIPTTYEFTDIAGLVKGASKGEGLGNKFLSHIREVDAIVEVVRCFEESDIIHVEGDVDPIRDIEIINTELIISDLEIVQNRIQKIEKKVQTTKDAPEEKEYHILKRFEESLLQEVPLRRIELEESDYIIIKNFSLITLKPIIYVANVSEEDAIVGKNKYTEIVREYASKEKASVVIMSAKIESELSELNETDKLNFLKDIGIQNSGLDKLIYETYYLLGLETYFTAGQVECRAWTYKKGMKAPECAGIIHTDFQRGFIRAEVISYEDIIEYKSELKVKEAGKMRLEGKEYVMKDGDICHFRFNVTK